MKPIRRVLVFCELGLSSPSVSVLDEQIRNVLQESPFQIELYREYLETTLFPSAEAQKEIQDSYIHKYRDRKPDVIITLGPSPLRFLADSHEKSFRGVPVVFGALSGAYLDVNLGPEFTGVWDRVEPAETLEIALRLKPATKHVVVVGGMNAFDKELERWFHERLHSYESKLEFTYLTDLPMPQLLEQLKRLPPNTIVLLAHIGLDYAGNRFVGASQADPMVVNAANAPVFGPSDVDLGHGEVGGYLDSFALQGKVMGEIATRILEGEKPQNIPVVRGTNTYMFDWRALERWEMKERDLPAGSIVLNRAPGFWETYKEYVLIGIFVLMAQTVAILALLWQRMERRKTEAELRKSEEKFSKSFRRSPLAVAITSAKDHRYIEVNDAFERDTGWRREEVIGRTPLDIAIWVDPNPKLAIVQQLLANSRVPDHEIIFRTKAGQVRTGLASAELIDVNGEPCALSVIADTTERKMAEEALANLSGRLIAAQEEERKRIAREIHDDYSQRLALLALDLENLAEESGNSSVEVGRRLRQVWNGIAEIGGDLHSLSHRLHSSTLDSLGLVAGVKAFCAEFAEQQEIQVDFADENIPSDVSGGVALCLFRIVQEGLRNIKRHSGAERAEVRLEGLAGRLHLSIADRGRGFDMNNRLPREGIGIRSMEERLRSLGGQLVVTSQPMQGTRINAWVPLTVARRVAVVTC